MFRCRTCKNAIWITLNFHSFQAIWFCKSAVGVMHQGIKIILKSLVGTAVTLLKLGPSKWFHVVPVYLHKIVPVLARLLVVKAWRYYKINKKYTLEDKNSYLVILENIPFYVGQFLFTYSMHQLMHYNSCICAAIADRYLMLSTSPCGHSYPNTIAAIKFGNRHVVGLLAFRFLNKSRKNFSLSFFDFQKYFLALRM